MITINNLKYKVLSILEALHLYEFPVKGTARITKTLAAMTETIQQLSIGQEEAEEELADVREAIQDLEDQKHELLTVAAKAAEVRNNLLTLMGE